MRVGMRARLFVPLAAGLVLIGAYTVMFGNSSQLQPRWVLGLLVLFAVAMVMNAELLVLRPLYALLEAVQDLARGRLPAAKIHVPAGPLRALAADLNRLRDRMQAYEAQLNEERLSRQALETNVRELSERYALTVERANDGIWEWNVKSGTVECSPRWKAMLDLSGDPPIARIEDWRELLHADERATVLTNLDNYLSGTAARFDEQYRLRQGDGRYRWVHSRAAAIRHATGAAYRVVFMDNDIDERKEIENALVVAAEGLSSVSGTSFFQALMRSLSSILGTRDNLVCFCVDDPPTKAQTLAYYSRGQFTENFEYELAGTSCGAVIDRREIVYCPTGVCELWPAEKQYDRDSYLGVPMFDSNGKVIGHFACMGGTPMRLDLPHMAIFKIFSVRAAAELERTRLRQQLEASQSAS